MEAQDSASDEERDFSWFDKDDDTPYLPVDMAQLTAGTLDVSSPDMSNAIRYVPIRNLNPHITCGICKGYLYEASTITECMHSFCKSCIVKHTEVNVNCPTCNVLIHPTDPLLHIKRDSTLQDIVYSLLPKVAEEEQERMRQYLETHAPYVDTPPDENEESSDIQMEDDTEKPETEEMYTTPISLILDCKSCPPSSPDQILEKTYVRVSGAATIANVISFLKRKLLLANPQSVDLYCACGSGTICLADTHTLKAVKDLYCRDQEFLRLQYQVITADPA